MDGKVNELGSAAIDNFQWDSVHRFLKEVIATDPECRLAKVTSFQSKFIEVYHA